MQDAARKQRTNKGEKSPMAKLKIDDVNTIESMYLSGHRSTHIAAIFGVSRSAIDRIIDGKNWGWRSGEAVAS